MRCHLEYAVTAWSLWTAGDRDTLEKGQIKAINLITRLEGKTYMKKVEELGIQSLEQRRVRFDLIQTYQILRGYDKVEKGTWFTLVGSDVARQTRMTSYKDNLVPKHSRTDL